VSRLGWVVGIAFVGLFVWLFASALFTSRSFVYRDAAHYYDPLFEWTADQWSDGRIPLWNPYDGLGAPALADATSSVLYPGKLIFALPIPYVARYKLFIMAHVVLAGAGAVLVAKKWDVSAGGAGIVGISYAFGGNVLFQYCNVVFLVGAAWMPLAFLATDRMLVNRQPKWAIVLGGILAMMVLGGDPQAAYHVGLLSAFYALLLWRSDRRAAKDKSHSEPATPTQDAAPPALLAKALHHRLAILILAGTCGAVLAAAQILPSMQWSRRSVRSVYDSPRNVWELASQVTANDVQPTNAVANGEEISTAQSLSGKTRPGTHHEHVFHFSVGPWRLTEYFWPNCGGQTFPVNRRWMSAIPAEGRTWTPSLYMGLLPIVLAISVWRICGAEVRRRWISSIALLAVLASFGSYGLGWLIEEVRYALSGNVDDLPVGSAFGGIYWLMTVILPGYVYFRYPAKLLTLAALPLSLLAGWGWDEAVRGKSRFVPRMLIAMALLSVLLLIGVVCIRPWWPGLLSDAPPSDLFGPIDASGAAFDLIWALVQTTVVAAVMAWIVSYRQPLALRWQVALVLLTAVELGVAQRWMLPTAPREIWDRQPQLARTIRAATEDGRPPARLDRFLPPHAVQPHWTESSSQNRQIDGLTWDTDILVPRHHLRQRMAVFDAPGTLVPLDQQVFFDQVQQLSQRNANDPSGLGYRLFTSGADYALMHETDEVPEAIARRVDNLGEGEAAVGLYQPIESLPRAWVVFNVQRLEPLTKHDLASLNRRTSEVLRQEGRLRSLDKSAVIEVFPNKAPKTERDTAGDAEKVHCEIQKYETLRVVVDVYLSQPGLLVLSDYYDPGWVANVESESSDGSSSKSRQPVLRTNRIMRGVWLDAGRHQVEFVYRPRSFQLGAIVSAIGWISIAVSLLLGRILRSRSTNRSRLSGTHTPCG